MTGTLLVKDKQDDSLFAANNLAHAMKVADLICKTDMTPKNYKNKPNDTLIAMELGRTWGLGPLQAIQNIAVINGKPCAYGDLVLAICQSHPDFSDIEEREIVESGNITGYECTITRKNRTPVTRKFTRKEAEQAKLWGKVGPWAQYPSRMLQMRARGFALRDSFADALNGVAVREEVEDYQIKDVTPVEHSSVVEKKNKVQQLLGQNVAPEAKGVPAPEEVALKEEKLEPVEQKKLDEAVGAIFDCEDLEQVKAVCAMLDKNVKLHADVKSAYHCQVQNLAAK